MPHAPVDSVTPEKITQQKVLRLLGSTTANPFLGIEERSHPWAVNRSTMLDFPLLRVWDIHSGSVPHDGSMISRAPDQLLQTKAARKSSLTRHLEHRNWDEPTPYISFTSSADAISELAYDRQVIRKRGMQTVTVIDPFLRSENGLPVLDVAAEMAHYAISDPYNRGNRYYINHYVCLWEVTPEEVVDHWSWDDLARVDHWYEDIIVPAFKRFRMAIDSAPTTAPGAALDMSAIESALPSLSPTESDEAQLGRSGNESEESDGQEASELKSANGLLEK